MKNAKKTISPILKRSISSFSLNILGTVLAFLTQIFLARNLGELQYGKYIYIITLAASLTLFANLGWDTLLLKDIAVYRAMEQWAYFKGLLSSANKVTLINSIFIVSVGLIFVFFFYRILFWEDRIDYIIGLSLIPLIAYLRLFSSILKSLKHVISAEISNLILRYSFLDIIVLVFLFGFEGNLNSKLVLFFEFISLLLSLLISIYLVRSKITFDLSQIVPEFKIRSWFLTALPLFFISAVNIILRRTDIIMIGAMIDTTQSGIYAVTTQITNLILFGIIAVNSAIAPLIAQAYANRDFDELQNVIYSSSKLILFLTCPIASFTCLAGRHLLGIFGDAFTSGYISLIILSLGQIVNAFSGSVGLIMAMTGNQNQAAIILGICSIFNITGNFFLISAYGINGAALSTALTAAIWNICLIVYIHKKIKVRTTLFQKILDV